MTDPGAPRRTALAEVHEHLGATLTTFAGWLMPLRYKSETAEHVAVRTAAGLFDLSHMGEISVSGPEAATALDYALVGNMSGLRPGRARYTMICSVDGGVLDDLIVYRLADAEYLVVANASNTATVGRELAERAHRYHAAVRDRTAEYALIAIQGPRAAAILARRTATGTDLETLKYYASQAAEIAGQRVLLARTGYTGEDGFEIFADAASAESIWAALAAEGETDGLIPAGLAARDTLRLEAGMPLYGNELSTEVTPFDAGLGRVVRLDKPADFVGKAALARRAEMVAERVLVGLTMASRRVPRHGYDVVWDHARCGTVTSGAPSPTLGVPIAMAYLSPEAANATATAGNAPSADTVSRLGIDIRGRLEPATVVPLPFYRRAT